MDDEKLQLFNEINDTRTPNFSKLYSLNFIVFSTVAFTVILVLGILLSIGVCIVIGRNRSLHTVTNFYLVNLSISELLLLICELPLEVYRLWNSFSNTLGKSLCITVGFWSETFANASVLTITAFTVERYISVCHPLMRHKRKSPRLVESITAIWICAMCCAVPQVMQFVIVSDAKKELIVNLGTVKGHVGHQVFVISSLILFVGAMLVILVLHVLMAVKLKSLPSMHPVDNSSIQRGARSNKTPRSNRDSSRSGVIWMLVAVTVSVFLCWAPLHALRLISIFGKNSEQPDDTSHELCVFLTPLSGMLYFLSTAINPFLCSIMSSEFRNAFKVMLTSLCRRQDRSQLDRTHSDLLASRNELAEARAEQRQRHSPLQLPTIFSQLCDAPPQEQVMLTSLCRRQDRSQLDRTHSDLLAFRNELAEARAEQRQRHSPLQLPTIFSQLCDLEHSNLNVVTEESESWHWRQHFSGELNSITSPRSISNSGLRDIDQEKSREESVIYLHQVNCEIVEENRDTSVEDVRL